MNMQTAITQSQLICDIISISSGKKSRFIREFIDRTVNFTVFLRNSAGIFYLDIYYYLNNDILLNKLSIN